VGASIYQCGDGSNECTAHLPPTLKELLQFWLGLPSLFLYFKIILKKLNWYF
jgi:hypothetical protein